MRAVGVEKATTVRAIFLDDFLRCDGALRDGLRRDVVHNGLAIRVHRGLAVGAQMGHLLWLDELHSVIRFEILYDALRNQEQSTDKRKWQQHPKTAADKIDPEIAKRLHLATRDAADERDGQHNPSGRRDEIVISEPRHLSEIAHGGLAGVGLPVSVGGKGSRGVESQMLRAHPGKMLRIEG